MTTSDVRVEDVIARSLAARLDVRTADAELAAIAERIPLERRESLLDLDLALHVERPTAGPNLIGPGLEVRVPVFDRGDASVAAAESLDRAALARRTALANEIEQSIRATWSRVESAEAASRLARDGLLARAERAAKLASEAHSRGDAPYTTHLAAEHMRVRALEAVLAAEVESARVRAAAERAAGIPWSELMTLVSSRAD